MEQIDDSEFYCNDATHSIDIVSDASNDKLDQILKCIKLNWCKKCPDRLRCLTEDKK